MRTRRSWPERCARIARSLPRMGRWLELAHRTKLPGSAREPGESLHGIFELFVEEIFARIAQEDQLTLLRLAEVPQLTIQTAIRASRDHRAGRIVRHSETLLRQGRRRLLADWLAKLPRMRTQEDAWLLYWPGAAQIGSVPTEARQMLERAYAVATTQDDGLVSRAKRRRNHRDGFSGVRRLRASGC